MIPCGISRYKTTSKWNVLFVDISGPTEEVGDEDTLPKERLEEAEQEEMTLLKQEFVPSSISTSKHSGWPILIVHTGNFWVALPLQRHYINACNEWINGITIISNCCDVIMWWSYIIESFAFIDEEEEEEIFMYFNFKLKQSQNELQT